MFGGFMDLETAKRLIETLTNNSGIAVDNRNKITAFEALLQEQKPELFQRYLKILENVRQNPQTAVSVEGFSTLQKMLVRG
jgi:hypothetical protein